MYHVASAVYRVDGFVVINPVATVDGMERVWAKDAQTDCAHRNKRSYVTLNNY